MKSTLHFIRSIAVYETKTLLRSWFFRIFAILAILVLSLTNFGLLLQAGGGVGEWSLRALPAQIPYVNLLLLNVVQAVIAIFLASDFLKRDKKLDTTEVIYMRPMTNGEYVVGKTLGNIVVFIVLNVLILAIALIFNLIVRNTSVTWIAYMWYFLFISLPTLVFIMGLSFFVMSLIKNQAVTFVVLLGYVAVSLFYLEDKFYYLFDYMAFNIPMAFSDFVGFGNIEKILVHRGMYFFLGLAFICFTVIMLKRLPHSTTTRYASLAIGILALIAGSALGYRHISSFANAERLRRDMIALNDSYTDTKQVYVNSYDIKLYHKGETIEYESTLEVENKLRAANDKIIFTLNPGIVVEKILVNGKEQPFSRNLNIIELRGFKLGPNEKAEITFSCQGKVNEEACYLDIDDETRNAGYSNSMYRIDKRYAFVTPEYLLLTRESNWYPVPGAGWGNLNYQWFARQFSNYTLEVNTMPGLMAISQGKSEQEGNRFTFTSENSQAQISLIAGPYQQINTNVEGLDFNLFLHKEHDYFTDLFEEIKDTIPAVIMETLMDFERNVDMYYPFGRISIVEVPIQFFSYPRILTGAMEQMQPEMLLFPEKGIFNWEADFHGRMEARQQSYGSGRSNETQTPQEKKIGLIRNFLAIFTRSQGRANFSRSQGQLQVTETPNAYYVFPLFYNYAYYIGSDKWPVVDRVFEAYKKQSVSGSSGMGWMRDIQGMSEDEQANVALLSQSFEEILYDPQHIQIVDNVIGLKGSALFSIVKCKAGEEVFDDFLYEYLNGIKFSAVTIEDFHDELMERFDIDLIGYMEKWYSSRELPAFLIGNVDAVRVIDVDEQKTRVKFKVSNTENTDGIIAVEVRLGGGGMMSFGRGGGSAGSSDSYTKLIFLEGNQTKEVTMLLSGTPRGGVIKTFTSKNIPAEMRLTFENAPEDNKAVPYAGEQVTDVPVRIAEDNEIIVDNEDPGFGTTVGDEASLLRRLLVKEEDKTGVYSGFSSWRAPREWTLTTNSGFYGAYVKSAHYIRGGEGRHKAWWNVPVTENGYYDVYVHFFRDDRMMRRRGGGGGGNNNTGEYHYIVHHDDGAEDIPVALNSAYTGWNHLGAFYFSSDTVLIELTDKSQSRVVVADAVKLIKQN